MRILQITPRYPPDHVGGVELHVQALSRDLARRGHEVAVLQRTADGSLPEFGVQQTRAAGVTLFRLCHRFGRTTRFLDLVRNPAVDRAAGLVLDSFRPDVVHAHHFTTLSASILEEIDCRGLPAIVSLHDYWLGCPRGQMFREDGEVCRDLIPSRCHSCLAAMWPGWFHEDGGKEKGPAGITAYHEVLRGLLGMARAVVTPSRFHRDRYAAFGWIDPEQVRVIPYGIPEIATGSRPPPPLARSSSCSATTAPRPGPPCPRGAPHPARPPKSRNARDPQPQEPQGDRPFRFGFLGTVIPSKGVHVLLEAFRRFPSGEAVALEIHGASPPYHQDATYGDRCRALAAGDARVRFTGRFEPEDTAGILADLDALVVPSLWEESYCIVAREGFRAGIPVILSDFGAAQEEFGDGRGALLVPRGRPGELYVAMRRLLGDPTLREKLILAPKRLLSPAENADRHEELYREVLAGRGRIPGRT